MLSLRRKGLLSAAQIDLAALLKVLGPCSAHLLN
jgi:hypothetical protein